MSSFPAGSQMDIHFPANLVPPTYFANIVQSGILEDEVYLNFCTRSIEKPMLRAELQCRIITTVAALRRLNQGLTQLLSQHDQQAQAKAVAQAAQAPSAGSQPTPQEVAQLAHLAKGMAAGAASQAPRAT